MTQTASSRADAIRIVIKEFLATRQGEKTEKIKDDDPKRDELLSALNEKFLMSNWLADAAKRVGQIQAVTHSLKPIHPDAKGTNLYCDPNTLSPIDEVGSHCLGNSAAMDVVGNAAALDVYKFLKLSFEDGTLLDLAIAGDVDFALALSEDPDGSREWMTAFAGLVRPQADLASHGWAKQIYWPVGNDPHDDAQFHLLAPLYPSSLVHRVYGELQASRFGDDAKAGREARKAGRSHPHPVHEYANLAIQQLGGTKPQNISQLNSERRGNNCLLESCPPVWHLPEVRPVLGVQSMFQRLDYHGAVRRLLRDLGQQFANDPTPNLATRSRRDESVEHILDEFLNFTAAVRRLPPGWSEVESCRLNAAHRRWLDMNAPVPDGDMAETISADFARWLNGYLRRTTKLLVGDAEFQHWRSLAHAQIDEFAEEVSNA